MFNPIKQLFGILYPIICLGCESDHPITSHVVCVKCLAAMPFTDHFDTVDNSFLRHFWGRVPVHHGASLMNYNPNEITQRLLHNFKYRKHVEIGEIFGRMMGHRIKSSSLLKNIDYIVPVPLTKNKKIKRGFNQSEILANSISQITEIPTLFDVLIRIKESDSQTRKNRVDRLKNMQDAFLIKNKEPLAGKHILLVDDVVTTGATLESCANQLLEGCKEISLVTLAIGSQL